MRVRRVERRQHKSAHVEDVGVCVAAGGLARAEEKRLDSRERRLGVVLRIFILHQSIPKGISKSSDL